MFTENKSSVEYSSFHRFGRHVCMDDEAFEKVLPFLKKYHIREITFFDSFCHSAHKLEDIESFVKKFATRVNVLHDIGVKVGINHLTTLGFFEQASNRLYREAPFTVWENGEKKVGNLCPSSEKTLEYIQNTYTLLANAKPDFIYIDDDMKLIRAAICYCDNCLCKFEKKHGYFQKNKMDITRQNLLKMLEDEEIMTAWLYFNRDLSANIYSLIEKTVHSIDPSISLGMMTCTGPFMESEIVSWTNALKGNMEHIRTRPGGGLYNDRTPMDLLQKVSSIAVQNFYLPNFVNHIEAEIECFPCQAMAKSNKYIALECLTYLATGCTGIAYSLFSGDYTSDEFLMRWKLSEQIDEFGKPFIEKVGRSSLKGANIFLGKNGGDDIRRKWNGYACNPDIFTTSGIPFTYNSEDADCYIITGAIASVLSNEDVEYIFKKPVFLTGDALEILNNKGYSHYTGVDVVAKYEKDTIERSLKNEVNGTNFADGNLSRDGVQAFYWFPDYSPAYSLKFRNKGEYITSINDFTDNNCDIRNEKLGYGMVHAVNDFGQRVVVSGYSALGYSDSYLRKQQIRQAYKFLTGKSDCVYSNGKLLMYKREINNDETCIVLINLSFDKIKDIVIELDEPVICENFTYYCEGETKESKVKCLEEGETSSKYKIEMIPDMAMGYFIIRRG